MTPDLEVAAYPQQTVLAVTGMSAATLQNWVNRGIIKLAAQNPGRHARRLYSQLDMMRLMTLFELTRVGISVARAAEFAEEVVVKHAYRLLEIADEEKRSGKTAYGNACRATFYYENGELQCLMEPTALHALHTGLHEGLRDDVVRITVSVSNIVWKVKLSLLEIEREECERVIAAHEGA